MNKHPPFSKSWFPRFQLTDCFPELVIDDAVCQLVNVLQKDRQQIS